jgi:hypothetical protein
VDARWGWLELVPGQGHWRPMDVEYKPAAPLPQLPPSRRPRHQRVRRPKSGSQAGLFGDSI